MEKIYVDTNILSRIIDKKISDSECDAIDKLCDREDIELVTSKKTLEEFLNTPDNKKRTALKLLYKIISKIPSENLIINYPATFGSIPFGVATFGGGYSSENKLFTNLKGVFKADDAEHIFQAIKAKCDYFLTLDRKTILKPAVTQKGKLHQLAPNLKFVNPLDLVSSLP